ncbi:hypothetical protein CROQUDRAFT_657242 [Cronartium quercuum f. sp. fusiforme G11]|uniref:RNA-binding protein n=1 Tax=Cronartium quercuum f. sp. fusiforme G11 TaxID=708437 RepID=A0A9P6NJ73_9BASI|nr:hypothetical protein CROQUDRAFT_657242 [Cronartium quercuum f. sp. fusiforme G11]
MKSSSSALRDFPPPTPTNLFLANFPKYWKSSDLAQMFVDIPILSVYVVPDPLAAGMNTGVGLVNVLYNHHAITLVRYLNRQTWLGSEGPLKVQLARSTAPPLKKRPSTASTHIRPVPEVRGKASTFPTFTLLNALAAKIETFAIPASVFAIFIPPYRLPGQIVQSYITLGSPLPYKNPKTSKWSNYLRKNETDSGSYPALPTTRRPSNLENGILAVSLSRTEIIPNFDEPIGVYSINELGIPTSTDELASTLVPHHPFDSPTTQHSEFASRKYSTSPPVQSSPSTYGYIGGPAMDMTTGQVFIPGRQKSLSESD